jgi:hypothetical protein
MPKFAFRKPFAAMKKIVLLFVSLIVLSCGNAVPDAELVKLNGYWEIETAIMPDGSKKEYTVNPTIDYFELKGKTGFRKKVMPQFDGTYRVNDLSEKIAIVQDSGKTYVSYVTDYAQWREEIVELSDDELVLKNNHKMEYHYKKPQPFTVK